jgi:hypothetical protein
MPGLVPGIHVSQRMRRRVDGRDKPGHDAWSWRFPARLLPGVMDYSITACCSAPPPAWLRSAALVEPIMMASGIEQRMKIITS